MECGKPLILFYKGILIAAWYLKKTCFITHTYRGYAINYLHVTLWRLHTTTLGTCNQKQQPHWELQLYLWSRREGALNKPRSKQWTHRGWKNHASCSRAGHAKQARPERKKMSSGSWGWMGDAEPSCHKMREGKKVNHILALSCMLHSLLCRWVFLRCLNPPCLECECHVLSSIWHLYAICSIKIWREKQN